MEYVITHPQNLSIHKNKYTNTHIPIECIIYEAFPYFSNILFVPAPGIRIDIRDTTDFCIRSPKIHTLG